MVKFCRLSELSIRTPTGFQVTGVAIFGEDCPVLFASLLSAAFTFGSSPFPEPYDGFGSAVRASARRSRTRNGLHSSNLSAGPCVSFKGQIYTRGGTILPCLSSPIKRFRVGCPFCMGADLIESFPLRINRRHRLRATAMQPCCLSRRGANGREN